MSRHARWCTAALVSAAALAACSPFVDDTVAAPTTPPAVTSSAAAPTPTPTPSPTLVSLVGPDAEVGRGVVTIDGGDAEVAGDCIIARDHGAAAVDQLTDAGVEILLGVDNFGPDTADAPVAPPLAVMLAGTANPQIVVHQGGDGEATYRGAVTAMELTDRITAGAIDLAVLHVEATTEREGRGAGPAAREVVIDVACAVERP